MNTLTASLRAGALRITLPIALALASIALMSPPAHAEDAQAISIAAPVVKQIGRDGATGAAIEEVTVKAHVTYNPATLTQPSGIRLLQKNVRRAAYRACADAWIEGDDPEDCIRDAVESAKPQIDAAVARAQGTHAR